MSTTVLHSFACPVCGAYRSLSPRALRLVETGVRSGECRTGEGCRAALDRAERYRRYWLKLAGVDEMRILRAGGAVAYVVEFGLPEVLHDIALTLAGLPVLEPMLRVAA
jgi:hypothetical protein